MATGNSSEMDQKCLLLWQGETSRVAAMPTPTPSPSPSPTTSSPDAAGVAVTSLVSLTDRKTVLADGCPCKAPSGAGVERHSPAGGEPPDPRLINSSEVLRPKGQPDTTQKVVSSSSSSSSQQPLLPDSPPKTTSSPKDTDDDPPTSRDVFLAAMSRPAKPCNSKACAENYAKLYLQVAETKHQLSILTVKMEEQASHISKLMEENRKYIRESGKVKKNRSRESHGLHTDGYADASGYGQPECPLELEDRVISLQLQNNELNLSLARERRKRREAEARLEKDESYIKRLEDSVQVLRGTRVVMDPSAYRQVAEAYMATRRTPARRPHTHTGVPGSDLVCDSSVDSSSLNHQRLSHPSPLETSSYPSSSDSSASSSPQYNPFLPSSQEPQSLCGGDISIPRSRNGKTKRDRGHNLQDMGRGLAVPANTMNPWDYQQLLESLEDLDGASRGALS